MPKNIEFVQIEAGEDSVSVRDRLSFLRGKHVLLVWPEEGTGLTRKLDLVLIQREAMRRAIRLAIVTHDPLVIKHANELNISTFETIGASERGRWQRGRAKVFANRHQRPKDEPEPDELMEVASRIRAPKSLPLPAIARVIILLLVLAVLGVTAYIVLPSATIDLFLEVETISVTVNLIASSNVSNVDVENSIIPSRRQPVEIQETGRRATTGSSDIPDTVASGTVTFINLTENAIQIPIGTVVQTTTAIPIRFVTTVDAVLPAGVESDIEVNIEAAQGYSGEIGNIDAGLINSVSAEWRDNVTLSNLSPTQGGVSRQLPMVTQTDIDLLRSTVRQQLFTRALVELEQFLSDSEFIIEETLQITDERSDWLTYSANVGDFVDSVELTMRAIVEAVVVSELQGERVVFAALGPEIRGRVIDPDSVEYTRGAVSEIAENGDVTFSMTGTVDVIPRVDQAQLQERIAGMSFAEATQYLSSVVSLEEGTVPQIVLNSPWVGDVLPLLPIRITVRVHGGIP